MKKPTLAFRSFLEGFTQSGLLGRAAMPGGAERICEETPNVQESAFAYLLLPILGWSQRAAGPLKHAGGFAAKDGDKIAFLDKAIRTAQPLGSLKLNALDRMPPLESAQTSVDPVKIVEKVKVAIEKHAL